MDDISRFNPRHGTSWMVAVAAALILLIAGVVHIRFGRQMTALVSDQFNQEQLAVARSVQKLVEQSFGGLEKELLQLADRIAAPSPRPLDLEARLQFELERMGTDGVEEIQIYDAAAGNLSIHTRGVPFETVAAKAKLPVEPPAGPGEIGVTRPEVSGSRVTMSMYTSLE
ncbi:MAG TPA: hypothetical protein VLT88_11820, partial [Desulfosarcina sp.]|nr:hypothetical protein [Desulfosarcina sp.]